MKRITDFIDKPSQALQAMVDGLRRQSKREDFKIYMQTFGDEVCGICFGCAATCTIQEVAGKYLKPGSIRGPQNRADYLQIEHRELNVFELIMDRARRGLLSGLFEFFGVIDQYDQGYGHRFSLFDDDWEKQLPEVEKLIAELREKNL